MLRYLQSHPEVYEIVEAAPRSLLRTSPAGITVNRVGSMFTFFFTAEPVTDWESAKARRYRPFRQFFHCMLDRGIYLAPSQFEAGFRFGGALASRTSPGPWKPPMSSSHPGGLRS